MVSHAEIERLVNHYQKQIKFLESYYADKLKAKDFGIVFSKSMPTSSYNSSNNKVIISYNNLEQTMSDNHSISYKAFYSILLHEIGHALHTGRLEYSITANVGEDNRIENLIQRWNGRTDFILMRYAFQDKVLNLETLQELVDNTPPDLLRNNPENTRLYKYAILALLRTVNNKKYVSYLAKDTRNINLLSQLFSKHKEYINIERPSDGVYHSVYLMNGNYNYDFEGETKKMLRLISDMRSILAVVLINMIDTTKQQQQQQQQQQDNEDEENESENDKSDKSDDNDNEPTEKGSDGIQTKSKETKDTTDSEDDTDDEPESEDEDTPEDTEDTEDDTDTEDTEDEDSDDTEDEDTDDEDTDNAEPDKDNTGLSESDREQLEHLENQLQDALYANNQHRQETNNSIGRLTNPTIDTENYTRMNLTAFTTLRRNGIKGSGTLPANSGSIKQLSMRRYARRDFVKVPEKYFDKRNSAVKGGANPKIMFYLDISGSMDGRRLRTALDYLRNFYDKLHQSVDIRMFCFGAYAYELSRQELNYDFLQQLTEPSTEPRWIEPLKDEEIIIITDGGWPKEYLREEWKRRAHVIVIDTSIEQIEHFAKNRGAADFREIKNLHLVKTENMVRELEKATSVINDKIKRR